MKHSFSLYRDSYFDETFYLNDSLMRIFKDLEVSLHEIFLEISLGVVS